MRRTTLLLILLTLTVTSAAEARWRHHHFGLRLHSRPVLLPAPEPEDARPRDSSLAALVPRDWQLEPASPTWQGRRYVAPDRSAWIAFYAANAANDAAARFKAVAFGDG